jgi:hypothetical protein
MKFEDLYNMFLEMYEKPNRMRASDGNTWFKGKPAGFMGDDGRAGVNGILPQGLFPQRKSKPSKNKYKK